MHRKLLFILFLVSCFAGNTISKVKHHAVKKNNKYCFSSIVNFKENKLGFSIKLAEREETFSVTKKDSSMVNALYKSYKNKMPVYVFFKGDTITKVRFPSRKQYMVFHEKRIKQSS